MKTIILVAVLWLCSLQFTFAARNTRKRKATADEDDDMRRARSLDDWNKLSRPTLNLIVAELSLEPRGSHAELAQRIFLHYHPQPQPDLTAPNPTHVNGDNVVIGDGQQPSSPMAAHFNELRDELYTVIASQIATITQDLSQQISQVTSSGTQTSASANNVQPVQQATTHQIPTSSNQLPHNSVSVNPVAAASQNQVPSHIPQINIPQQSNNFRFPAISTTNINLIQNGKYVNFDTLLPSSLSHPTSGYSIHLAQSSSGVDGEMPFTIHPQSSRRTIKNFPSWLSAWNIFIQAFCFFFPGFAGLLLAYQSQLTIYASRYEFSAWSTYDKLFRQNMANLHPNSPWSEVDRHLFDEVLLCAPVLAVCHTCREPGHYNSACPYRSSASHTGGAVSTAQRPVTQSQPPFLAPQRAAHPPTQPPVRGPFRANTSPCRFFNAGTCNFRTCRFPHICTTCRGSHPASQCPNRPGP
jgi:hypothetical protein